MKRQAIAILVCVLFTSNVAADNPFTPGPMTPRAVEKLSNPIKLNDLCSEVTVIEWRPTFGLEDSTGQSSKAIKLLNQVCNFAVKSFPKFINSHYDFANEEEKLSQSLCLMPADVNQDGQDVRNLNDVNYRFINRTKEYDENGIPFPIWGYHQRSTAHIYIRNDVFNTEFKTIFAHELFHAMSYQYGIYSQHNDDRDEADEKLARKFTKFLGLGE